jgi:hypothetical protein
MQRDESISEVFWLALFFAEIPNVAVLVLREPIERVFRERIRLCARTTPKAFARRRPDKSHAQHGLEQGRMTKE